MWIRIHDTLEENGIDTILANPYKTKKIYDKGRSVYWS
jgi:transposase